MNSEMDYHLDGGKNPDADLTDCRNGRGHKVVKGDFGEVEIETKPVCSL